MMTTPTQPTEAVTKALRVALEMLKKGEKPTQKKILLALGGGSQSTANQAMNQLWDHLSRLLRVGDLPGPVISLAHEVWIATKEEANKELASLKKRMAEMESDKQRELDDSRARIENREKILGDTEAELEKYKTEHKNQGRQISELISRDSDHQKLIASQKSTIGGLEGLVDQLNERLTAESERWISQQEAYERRHLEQRAMYEAGLEKLETKNTGLLANEAMLTEKLQNTELSLQSSERELERLGQEKKELSEELTSTRKELREANMLVKEKEGHLASECIRSSGALQRATDQGEEIHRLNDQISQLISTLAKTSKPDLSPGKKEP